MTYVQESVHELLKRATRDTAERLRGAVEAIRIELENGDTLSFTISIGTTQLASRATLVEDLMIEADEALYRAKAEGRNRVVTHPPHITETSETTSLP